MADIISKVVTKEYEDGWERIFGKKNNAKQELFDKVVTHLRKQGVKAIGPSNKQCYYRIEGLKCAVGCLIEDDEYSPTMEDVNFRAMMSGGSSATVPQSLRGRLIDHIDMISHLQCIHDNTEVSTWENQFKALAADYNLTLFPIQETL